MSDLGSFPGIREPFVQWFSPQGARLSGAQQWQIWEKPRGVTFVFLVLQGAGAGGGGGFTRASGNGGGGGGGASGGRVVAVVPAVLLPERLYLSIAKGGVGSTGSGVVGGNPDVSYLSVYPDISAGPNFASVGASTGGGAGALASVGAGGTPAGTPATASSFVKGHMLYVALTGVAGVQGGPVSGGAGIGTTIGGSQAGTSGGCGGGGTSAGDFAGGSMTTPLAAWFPQLVGGAAGSNPGPPGYWTWGPNFVGGSGGTGGGSSNAGVGGKGGDGALGSGGGGGGAGTTGGGGGNGGDGFAMIVCV